MFGPRHTGCENYTKVFIFTSTLNGVITNFVRNNGRRGQRTVKVITTVFRVLIVIYQVLALLGFALLALICHALLALLTAHRWEDECRRLALKIRTEFDELLPLL